MRRRVLLVDDEPLVVRGVARALRRGDWELVPVVGGDEACTALAREPVDLVVTDLRMPGIDGVGVLRAARDLQPHAVRIALSGYVDTDLARAAVELAHRFVAKPVAPDRLAAVLVETSEVAAALADPAARELLGRATALPTATTPDVVGDFDDLVRAVEQDPAMTARVLHVVGSPFFGVSRPVRSAREAVVLLGADLVRSLVLAEATLAPAAGGPAAVGRAARRVRDRGLAAVAALGGMTEEPLAPGACRESAAVACLLHDVGALVLAGSGDPALVACVEDALATRRIPGLEPTVGQLGAQLLRLWNLPARVVAAVAGHEREPGPGPLDEAGLVARATAVAHGADPGGRPTTLEEVPT